MKCYDPNSVKKTVLILVISLLLAFVLLTGCNKKIDNTQSAVVEANRELDRATQGNLAEINQYWKGEAIMNAANDSKLKWLMKRLI